MSLDTQSEAASESVVKPITVALVGNPNTGKTSLFNRLTGLRARTANYPGITVDLRHGELFPDNSRQSADIPKVALELVDLPGLYSLEPVTPEEQVAARFLAGSDTKPPGIVVVVVDATNVARNLFLASQILDLNLPTIVALNFADVANAAGIEIDSSILSKQLGCPVILVSARTGAGIPQLRQQIFRMTSPSPTALPIVRESCVRGCSGCNFAARHSWSDQVVEAAVRGTMSRSRRVESIDRWLTSPVMGTVSLLLVMFGVFFLIFSLADIPMTIIEKGFGWIGDCIAAVLPEEAPPKILWVPLVTVVSLSVIALAYWLGDVKWSKTTGSVATIVSLIAAVLPIEDFRSLVIDGVVGGVGGIVVFLPQICILFFFIALLEDSGYMAGGAFVMER